MIYVLFADGFEEIEAITPVDVIRRAGKQVTTVGVTGDCVNGAHGLSLNTDIGIDQVLTDDMEMLILPGGMPGTKNLFNNSKVIELVKYAFQNNKKIGAICAAPLILGRLGMLNGKQAICYPGFENELKGAIISEDLVVCDGNIITAKGAGVALEFALNLVNTLCGHEMSSKLAKELQCK